MTTHVGKTLARNTEPSGSEQQESAWMDVLPSEARAQLDERSLLLYGDALDVLEHLPPNSIHAVVTDPPYSPLEYDPTNQRKLRNGRGGVWRIPPSFDGVQRRPLPRFTVLKEVDFDVLEEFFETLAKALLRVLVPGGHVLLASNPLLSDVAFHPFRVAGFEKRGVIVRGVVTFRGGDRPKGAHEEFAGLCSMPRSCHEPWGLFRKPMNKTLADNLREWSAGALRRPSLERPFMDYIPCAPARGIERQLSSHPSLKPQRFLRQVVAAAIPLGKGIVLDPFAGSSSTLAAAARLGFCSLGIERDEQYYVEAQRSFQQLRDLPLGTLE